MGQHEVRGARIPVRERRILKEGPGDFELWIGQGNGGPRNAPMVFHIEERHGVVDRLDTRQDHDGKNELAGQHALGATEDELKSFLATQIAEFKIPARILAIDALPLTHSGKIDHKALAARYASAGAC